MVTLNKPTAGNTDWYQSVTDNWSLLETVTRYDVQPTTQSVGDTTTETTIYSKTIAAGDMGSDGKLHLWVNLRLAEDAGGATLPALRIKFGGTTLAQFVPKPTRSATDFLRALLEVDISNTTASSQRIAAHFVMHKNYLPDSSTPFSDPTDPEGNDWAINSAAIDTTSAALLEITAQWPNSPQRDPSLERCSTPPWI